MAKTIGMPLMAPANFGPETFAITRIIAVITAEAKLFNMISHIYK